MVGHQHVRVKRTSFLVQRFVQPVQIGMVVFFAEEAGFAVVTALHDVQRYAIKVNPGTTGHNQTIAEKSSLAPFLFFAFCCRLLAKIRAAALFG